MCSRASLRHGPAVALGISNGFPNVLVLMIGHFLAFSSCLVTMTIIPLRQSVAKPIRPAVGFISRHGFGHSSGHHARANRVIPGAARLDALHVATAALAGVQYLLTLNCRHIANAHVLPGVYRLLDDLGLPGTLIATPIEFLGGTSNGESNS